ncbi:hypothetical protein MKEN_01362800 [Mycena kentingensis (nom. inval.)]|nr:hypothetical protein MKEN_01362800 [Mycena kentingensis (nom. inval.)]
MGWSSSLSSPPWAVRYIHIQQPCFPATAHVPGAIDSWPRRSYPAPTHWVKDLQDVDFRNSLDLWEALSATVVDRIDHIRLNSDLKHTRDDPGTSESESRLKCHEALAFEYHYTTAHSSDPETFCRAAMIVLGEVDPSESKALTTNGFLDIDLRNQVHLYASYAALRISLSKIPSTSNRFRYFCWRTLLPRSSSLNPDNAKHSPITLVDMAILSKLVSDSGEKHNIRQSGWFADVQFQAIQRIARVGEPSAVLELANADTVGAPAHWPWLEALRMCARKIWPVKEQKIGGAEDLNCRISMSEHDQPVDPNIIDSIVADFAKEREEFRKAVETRTAHAEFEVDRAIRKVEDAERLVEAAKRRAEDARRRAEEAKRRVLERECVDRALAPETIRVGECPRE